MLRINNCVSNESGGDAAFPKTCSIRLSALLARSSSLGLFSLESAYPGFGNPGGGPSGSGGLWEPAAWELALAIAKPKATAVRLVVSIGLSHGGNGRSTIGPQAVASIVWALTSMRMATQTCWAPTSQRAVPVGATRYMLTWMTMDEMDDWYDQRKLGSNTSVLRTNRIVIYIQ